MHELGLLEGLLRLPHQKIPRFSARIAERDVTIADLSHLPVRSRFIAMMPQWDFLDFLAGEAKRYPTFGLRMNAEVTGLVERNQRIVGLRLKDEELLADLVIGADGRHSTVRATARLPAEEFGVPMDVLWFRLSRRAADPEQTMGLFSAGRILILHNRGDYWQCGYVIGKGAADEVRSRGLPWFRESVVKLLPWLADRVTELTDWDRIKLLTVRVDRLRRWYQPGLLCIGDAAHAMSPVGGVGINLAIQDAVAAANILARPLRDGTVSVKDLDKIQRRRQLPTRITQGLQVFLQERVIRPVLVSNRQVRAPWVIR